MYISDVIAVTQIGLYRVVTFCKEPCKCEGELINMTRAWDSPTGIEPMTSRTPGGRSIH